MTLNDDHLNSRSMSALFMVFFEVIFEGKGLG